MVFPGWVALLPVVSTVAVLIGGMAKPWGVGVLSNKPMVILGDTSYSWYLWHWPFIAFGVMLFPGSENIKLIVAVLSLFVALGTTRFIENPIRFSTHLAGYKSWLILAGSVFAVVAVSGALIVGSRNYWWNDNIQIMQEQVSKEHLWLTSGCSSAIPLGERGPECTWNSEANALPVYLVGDSLAGALSEAVLGAGTELGRPVVVGTQGACPFVGSGVSFDGRLNAECTDFVSNSTAWLMEQLPGDVVLSSSLGYLVLGSVSLSFPANTPAESSYDAKLLRYVAGLTQTVKDLTSQGHRVHVVLPPPGIPADSDGCERLVSLPVQHAGRFARH